MTTLTTSYVGLAY